MVPNPFGVMVFPDMVAFPDLMLKTTGNPEVAVGIGFITIGGSVMILAGMDVKLPMLWGKPPLRLKVRLPLPTAKVPPNPGARLVARKSEGENVWLEKVART